MTLTVTQKAPDFTLPTDGDDFTLSSLSGPAIIYFYPKDMTPGCTTESIDFSDLYDDFKAMNCEIIGVSKDSPARHGKFRAKHDLKPVLVSDEEGTLCEAYGVWQEKKLYGKVYMGIVRSTFLIDDKGVVQHIWPKVKVKGHAQDVLDTLKAMQST